MISEYQKEIIAVIRKNGTATTQYLVDKFGCHTPYQPRKYVGMAVSRMVKSGLLKRIKPGVFEIGMGKKSKLSTLDAGQLNLEL